MPCETEDGLDAPVSEHFGHCPFFAFVELQGASIAGVEVEQNPHHAAHRPGSVPAFIHDRNAEVMISGRMGRRAKVFFEGYAIRTAMGASGTVREAIEGFLRGDLPETVECGGHGQGGHGQHHGHGHGEGGHGHHGGHGGCQH